MALTDFSDPRSPSDTWLLAPEMTGMRRGALTELSSWFARQWHRSLPCSVLQACRLIPWHPNSQLKDLLNRLKAVHISAVSKFLRSGVVFGVCSETAWLCSALMQTMDLMSHLSSGSWKMESVDMCEFVFGQKKRRGCKSKQPEVEQRYQIPFLSKWNYCNDWSSFATGYSQQAWGMCNLRLGISTTS